MWADSLKRMKEVENPYYIGMGDYEDFISASERRAMFGGNLHDSTEETLYDYSDRLVKELAGELSFMRGRVLGLLGGNHYMVYPNGYTSDHKLAELLRCRYLGCTSVLMIQVLISGIIRCGFTIWAHHGTGGGARTPGGSINRVEQMRECFEADCYLMGHAHDRHIAPMMKLELVTTTENPHVRPKKQWLARTGSFLNAYVPGKRSYVASDAKSPRDLGCVRLDLTTVREPRPSRGYRIETTGGYL